MTQRIERDMRQLMSNQLRERNPTSLEDLGREEEVRIGGRYLNRREIAFAIIGPLLEKLEAVAREAEGRLGSIEDAEERHVDIEQGGSQF